VTLPPTEGPPGPWVFTDDDDGVLAWIRTDGVRIYCTRCLDREWIGAELVLMQLIMRTFVEAHALCRSRRRYA